MKIRRVSNWTNLGIVFGRKVPNKVHWILWLVKKVSSLYINNGYYTVHGTIRATHVTIYPTLEDESFPRGKSILVSFSVLVYVVSVNVRPDVILKDYKTETTGEEGIFIIFDIKYKYASRISVYIIIIYNFVKEVRLLIEKEGQNFL